MSIICVNILSIGLAKLEETDIFTSCNSSFHFGGPESTKASGSFHSLIRVSKQFLKKVAIKAETNRERLMCHIVKKQHLKRKKNIETLIYKIKVRQKLFCKTATWVKMLELAIKTMFKKVFFQSGTVQIFFCWIFFSLNNIRFWDLFRNNCRHGKRILFKSIQ